MGESLSKNDNDSGDSDDDDDVEDEDDCIDEDEEEDIEDSGDPLQIPRKTNFSLVEIGAYIAIFSQTHTHTHTNTHTHTRAAELFYICKVIDKGKAKNDIIDINHHPVKKGEQYITVVYLEKLKEKRSKYYNLKTMKYLLHCL